MRFNDYPSNEFSDAYERRRKAPFKCGWCHQRFPTVEGRRLHQQQSAHGMRA